MIMLELTYQNRTYRIGPDNTPFNIGRLPENNLCLESEYVTDLHGCILVQDGKIVYEDIDSTNGTSIIFQDSSEEFVKKSSVFLSGKGSIRFGGESGAEVFFKVVDMQWEDEFEDKFSVETGLICIQTGDFKTAFHIFEQLVQKRPDDSSPYYYAGFAASYLNDPETAILRFEQCLMLQPNDANVRIDLGKIYEKAGNRDKALDCYRRVLKADPLNREAEEKLREFARFQAPTSVSSLKGKTREILKGYDVQKVEGDHFQVTYSVAVHLDILKDILKALETACQDVGRLLKYSPSEIISVTLLEPYGDVSGKTGPDGIELLVNQEILGEKPFLPVLVNHEYAHYALGSITGFSNYVPWWLQEGFSQYVSQNITHNRLINMKALAQERRPIPLSALEKGAGNITDREVVGIAYLEAHLAVAFFIKQHGYEGLRQLIEALNKKKNINKAFTHMRLDFSRFEIEWVEWLAESVESGTVKLTREIKKDLSRK